MKKKSHMIGTILIITITTMITSTVFWILNTWSNFDMGSLLYQLKVSIEGMDKAFIRNGVISIFVPVGVTVIIVSLIMVGVRKNEKRSTFYRRALVFCSVAISVISLTMVGHELDVIHYFRLAFQSSDFVEKMYIAPKMSDINFPKKKRNLLYIYLESMEVTYSGKENGGAFDVNYIPELTQLAQDYEDFSGKETYLNGGHSLYGSAWTMGSMFAQTSGLPLKTDHEVTIIKKSEEFFPKIQTLGDILEETGYYQELLLGSDANFAGTSLFFEEHGNYMINDYLYAKEHSMIPQDYLEFWGYEDEKLFAFAKQRLLTISENEEPFNLTVATIDTHYEDGYKCRLCPDTYGDNQYANALACSSKQVTDFIKWVQEQEFYKNTTIILVGDHPTMDKDFCASVDKNYKRKVYVNIINSAIEVENPELYRTYSTMDMFPTTLAALGVQIKGNRLGLGTNLFSTEKTLMEQYDEDYINDEMIKQSDYMENLLKKN